MDTPRELVRERLGALEDALGGDIDLFAALPVPVRGRLVEGMLSGALDRERARDLLTPVMVASEMGDAESAAGLLPAPWPPPSAKRRVRELNRHLDELRTFALVRYGLMYWGGKQNYLAAIREQDEAADEFSRRFVWLEETLDDAPYRVCSDEDLDRRGCWACSRVLRRRRAELALYVRSGALERTERELGLDPAEARAEEDRAAAHEMLGDIEEAIRLSPTLDLCEERVLSRSWLVGKAVQAYEHALRTVAGEGLPPLRMMEIPDFFEERVARNEVDARMSATRADRAFGDGGATIVRRANAAEASDFAPAWQRPGVSRGDAEEEHRAVFAAANYFDGPRLIIEEAEKHARVKAGAGEG